MWLVHSSQAFGDYRNQAGSWNFKEVETMADFGLMGKHLYVDKIKVRQNHFSSL
jgi:hypothetical protein